MRNLLIVSICCAAAAFVTSCRTKPAGPRKTTIAVIPKGTTHEFWLSVKAGAVRAGAELPDVDVEWIGPEKEDDRTQQIAIVENMVLKGVDGIVLAPLDRKALMGPVAKAKAAGIPTVVIDSGLDGNDWISFVATDNFKGGQLGGQRCADLLDGNGTAIMLRYQENSASTENREAGFLEVMAAHKDKGIVVASSETYGGATNASAQEASATLLRRFTDSEGKLTIDGIFTPNASTTIGMLMALRTQGFAGKVKFVGFDSTEQLTDALRKGQIDGLVLQNPMNMGYLGVKAVVRHLKKENVEPRIDTGVVLVTKENIDKPELRDVVNPDFDKWLKQD